MDDIKLEETFIKTNGIRLPPVMAGPQSSPPIIFLHGFPENRRPWIKQISALAQAGSESLCQINEGIT